MAFTITTVSLPSAVIGVPYSTTLATTGGVAPISWTLKTGTLPAGLTLVAATGIVHGTPTALASATPLTFEATDSTPVTPQVADSTGLTLTVAAVMAITTASLPDGKIGVAYSQTLGVSGGIAPFTWALISGKLPRGLSLNTSTGVISGTPQAGAPRASLTFQVTDSATPTAEVATVTLSIAVPALFFPANVTDKVSPTFPLLPLAWPLTIIPGSDPLAAETQPQSFDPTNAEQSNIVTTALLQSGNSNLRLP